MSSYKITHNITQLIMKVLRLLEKFLFRPNVEGGFEDNRVRLTVLINTFIFVGVFSTTFFAFVTMGHVSVALTLAMFGATALYSIAYIYLRFSNNVKVVAVFIVVVLTCIEFMLTISGGENYTGALWLFVYPLVVFFLLGLKKGLIWNLALFVPILVLIFSDFQFVADYSLMFKSRLVVIYISISLMSAIYEYVRQTTRQRLDEVDEKKTYYLTELESHKAELLAQTEELSTINNELVLHKDHLEEMVTERTFELVKAKIKAEESDMLKSAFLANMSHEIRTPMNAIIGFTQLFLSSEISDTDKIIFGKYIISNANSLLELISDIISVSKIESKQLPITLKETNLNKVIDDFGKEISEKYENEISNNINFRIENKCEEDLVVEVDRVQIKQVLIKLVDNAFKFSTKGDIVLSYNIVKDNTASILEFYVKDEGVGIPDDMSDKIFQKFVKVVKDDADILYRGTGLGLWICKETVELLGGNISFKSNVDEGTTFYVQLPLNATK